MFARAFDSMYKLAFFVVSGSGKRKILRLAACHRPYTNSALSTEVAAERILRYMDTYLDGTPPPFLKRTRIPPDTNWYQIDSKEGTAVLVEIYSNPVAIYCFPLLFLYFL
jgi:hypothetical protein